MYCEKPGMVRHNLSSHGICKKVWGMNTDKQDMEHHGIKINDVSMCIQRKENKISIGKIKKSIWKI